MPRLVLISDTHTYHRSVTLPEGDILVVAGDITNKGELDTLMDLNKWFGEQSFKKIVCIAGNHDWCFQHNREQCERILTNCVYLQDSEAEIEGVKFYGSPWTPWFYSWAFNFPDPAENKARARSHAENCWGQIPFDTEVLITHGPPKDYADLIMPEHRRPGEDPHVGCPYLAETIEGLACLKLHVFGHIHCGYGIEYLHQAHRADKPIPIVNASVCTEKYRPTNPPIVIDI